MEVPKEIPYLVVGAGIHGLSTAYHLAKELQTRGHKVSARRGALWAPSVLRIDPATGLIEAAGDPRAGRHASGF